jgi:hypothetical protein
MVRGARPSRASAFEVESIARVARGCNDEICGKNAAGTMDAALS